MAITPPFTFHYGDEDKQNPGHGIMKHQTGPHQTIQDAHNEVALLQQDKFWEIRDSTGAWVTGGYKPIVHPKPKGKGGKGKGKKK